MKLLQRVKDALFAGGKQDRETPDNAKTCRKPEPKKFGPFTSAHYIRLAAGGRNVMWLNTCKVTKADADRISDKMYDEEYEDEIDEGTFLDNYFDRANACCRSYSVINLWNEHSKSIYDTDEVLCQVLDADGKVLDEGPIPLSPESIADTTCATSAHSPQHMLVSGYSVEEVTVKFECPADIDISQLRFMPGIPISSGGEWLSPNMLRLDCVVYKGAPLRLVDTAEGDSEDYYYALLEQENGKAEYSLVDECSTELS